MSVYEDDYPAFLAYWLGNQPLPKKSDEFLTMGSIIDTLITRPQDYDNDFIIFTGEAPTAPQMVQFCSKLAGLYTPGLPLDSYYQLAYDAVGIKTPKLEGFITKFELYKDYFNFLVNRGNKIVLTTEQASKAGRIVEQLKTNPYTKDLVNAQGEGVYNQLEVYSERNGLRLKGAIDRVLISHKKKTILPIDFKSSYDVRHFSQSYYKYRYYRQGSYYRYLLSMWARDQGYKDYIILPFRFVVCSTSGGTHWQYVMGDMDIAAAQEGGITSWGYLVKGWREILTEIEYMRDNKEWNYPYECQVNNGIIELNIFK